MKKKVPVKDALKASLFIIFCIWVITLIPFNSDLLNPIEKTFSDFKLTDIYYSHIKENPEVSDDIVLVNIGYLPREGIAEMVNIINEYQPKVIGIDAFFRLAKNPEGDQALRHAFRTTSNLVLVSELYENPTQPKIDSIGYSHSMFMEYAIPGFADMISEGKDIFKTARDCVPKEYYDGDTVLSFPVQLAKFIAPDAANSFIARDNEVEEINYQGNIITHIEGVSPNSKNVFYALDVAQVFNRDFAPEVIKNKIVIMGFMGANFTDRSWEDKFFTPLNINYLGKTNPDMFGVVAHANIVAMILKEDYINSVPDTLVYLLSVLFIVINTWFFTWMFLNLGEWWDGISMMVALVEVLLISSLTIFIFHLFNLKFDITFMILALFVTGNLVEVYFGLLTKTVTRIKVKTKKKPHKTHNQQESLEKPQNYEVN